MRIYIPWEITKESINANTAIFLLPVQVIDERSTLGQGGNTADRKLPVLNAILNASYKVNGNSIGYSTSLCFSLFHNRATTLESCHTFYKGSSSILITRILIFISYCYY